MRKYVSGGFGVVWRGFLGGGLTNHDQPFWFLDTLRVGLRVSKRLPFCFFGFFDFIFGAVADEDGFAAPFDDYLYSMLCQLVSEDFDWRMRGGKAYVLALGYSIQVNLDFSLCEHVR